MMDKLASKLNEFAEKYQDGQIEKAFAAAAIAYFGVVGIIVLLSM